MNGRFLRIVGRLKPGVTLVEAQRDLDRVAAEIRTALSAQDTTFQLRIAGLQADAFADVAPALRALLAGAAFVLLICCVNVSSLLLARAGDRRKEIALRLSLGASRGRIVRQLFAEGLLLCVIGGACGVAVGWAGFRGLLAIRPERLSRIADTGLSWPALAFAAAASLAAAILFALAPALEGLQLDLIATLRAAGRVDGPRAPTRRGGAGGGRDGAWLRAGNRRGDDGADALADRAGASGLSAEPCSDLSAPGGLLARRSPRDGRVGRRAGLDPGRRARRAISISRSTSTFPTGMDPTARKARRRIATPPGSPISARSRPDTSRRWACD